MKGSDASVTPKGRLLRTPDMPKTPLKSFRIPLELFQAAQAAAARNGESVSDVVRRSLIAYVEQTTIG